MLLYAEPPAFNLPSSEAESLAAIAYLALVAPESFSINYSADASALTTAHLPTLNEESANAWASGFNSIVLQLRQSGLDADESLDSITKAEVVAYSTLIARKASDLTSLSLFGDDENYDKYTRKTLGEALSFPRNYTIPNERRLKALQRLKDLGLETQEEVPSQGLFQTKKRAAIKYQARQIRIQGMADELYSILESKLSNGPFLFGNKPTSIDCLVFGHLSMHLFPTVPNNYLANRLKDSFPRTWKFIVDFNTNFIDNKTLDVAPSQTFSLGLLLKSIWHEIMPTRPRHTISPETESETDNVKARKDWRSKAVFIAGTAALLVGFVLTNNMIVLDMGNEADDYMESQDFNSMTDDDDENDSDADDELD